MSQLRMMFPLENLAKIEVPPLKNGFELRLFRPEDLPSYIALMQSAGFDCWNEAYAKNVLAHALPDGIFFAVEKETGKLAATAMANIPTEIGHEMGWVAASPDFRGCGLGKIVCAAALRRFLKESCSHIYLLTDDFRIPALKIYLKMGWKPEMVDDTHPERWKEIFDHVNS